MTDLFGNIDEEAMYRMALAVPLEEKIQSAIGLIQLYEKQALELSEDGYYCCFSGGKDSIVMAKLFEMSGVKFQLHINNTTIDPPELIWFVKKSYPDVVWHHPEMHMLTYMVKHKQGLPTRKKRWCCEIYKESSGTGFFKAIGVRADESARRKGIWRTVVDDRKGSGGKFLCPILYWTDADIWQFITDNNMPYCSLYDEGYKRLGCIGCPMSGKGRQRDFEKYPKFKKLWLDATRKWWANWKHIPTRDGRIRLDKIATAEDYFSWWLEEDNDTDQPDCQLYLW